MILAFVEVDSGVEIGRVEMVDAFDPETLEPAGKTLIADRDVRTVVDVHQGSAEDFMHRYRDWSNGYVRAVRL